jgi:hypothetical protein
VLILKELAVGGNAVGVVEVEPGGVPVWLAWVDLSGWLRARGRSGGNDRGRGLGCRRGSGLIGGLCGVVQVGSFAALGMTGRGRGKSRFLATLGMTIHRGFGGRRDVVGGSGAGLPTGSSECLGWAG